MDNNINKYILSRRGVGHTRLLKEGANNYDGPFFVVGADTNHVSRLRQELNNTKAIPVNIENSNHVLHGVHHPMIIDNHAYSMTCEKYERKIDELENEIDLLKVRITLGEATNDRLKKTITNLQIAIRYISTISLFKRMFKYKETCEQFQHKDDDE